MNNDFFALHEIVSASANADEDDVRRTKHTLNRLGYYTPDDDLGITGIPDQRLFDAIGAFQADHKLPPTKTLRPDDETVQTIAAAIEDQPIRQKYIWRTVGDEKVRGDHAAREGKVFSWLDRPVPGDDHNCRCWAEPFEGMKSPEQIYDPGTVAEYPELDLIGFLSGAKIVLAIKAVLAGKVTKRIEIVTTRDQLQRKFKHAKFFGIKGNQNNSSLVEYRKALEAHISSPATKAIQGKYHKQDVIHYYNSKTKLNVITSRNNEFISAWKLQEKQIKYLLKTGKLGGSKK